MIRVVIAVAAVTLGAGVVLAQSDAATQRQAIMKANGKSVYAGLNGMVKGTTPYDQAAVDAALTQLETDTKKLLTLYPDTAKASVTGANYSASPKIWENKADFDAHITKLDAAVAAAKGKIKDLDSLKAIYPSLNGACGGCHETYRVKNG